MEIAKLILASITIILLIYNLIVHLQIYRKQKAIDKMFIEVSKKQALNAEKLKNIFKRNENNN